MSEPRYREHAELVRDAGLKLLKLVNDVVEVARLEAGVVDLDIHAEESLSIIDEVFKALRQEAGERGVSLTVEESESGWVLADSRGLQTALSHLVQNAIEASPEGGVVRLSLRRIGSMIALEVADDGPGVPIQDITRILRPFEQGQNALTRSTEGAGLGLPIARGLVQAMGGRLRLAAEPGQGLRATIYLPAADQN
jgi:signal transduction histidine kinase